LHGEPGDQLLVFGTTVPANLDGPELEATIRAVVDTAYSIAEELTGEEESAEAPRGNHLAR
jgi:hypothetical protein